MPYMSDSTLYRIVRAVEAIDDHTYDVLGGDDGTSSYTIVQEHCEDILDMLDDAVGHTRVAGMIDFVRAQFAKANERAEAYVHDLTR